MIKEYFSDGYNFVFNTKNGKFIRWGKDFIDNPDYSPNGCEILDLELSSGHCSGNCQFCYKENSNSSPNSTHMSLHQFKLLLSKFNLKVLTQIALGLCDLNSNIDLWEICKYSISKGIIPNYTCNGFFVDEEVARKTQELCGAVAVSIVDKETSFNAIQMFLNAGVEQVNIHYMLSMETYNEAFTLIDEVCEQIPGLNAIVFLQYKPKGSGVGHFHSIESTEKYKKLIEYCLKKKIGFGFDSCSAPLFMKTAMELNKPEWLTLCDPCESSLFSAYVNVHGEFFPCSFCEGVTGWEEGIRLMDYTSFDDVWNHPRVIEWRNNLINSSKGCKHCSIIGCRSCPVYDLSPCKRE